MIRTEDHICPITKKPCREDCAWNVNEKMTVKTGPIIKTTKPLCAAAVIADSLRVFVQTLMEESADE